MDDTIVMKDERLPKSQFELREGTVTKTYSDRYKEGCKEPDVIFQSELNAYKYFSKIRWKWAPQLIGFDIEKRQIELQRIDGETILRKVFLNREFNIQYVIDQLIELDHLLWLRRINCLEITSHDIIVEKETSRIYMVDYEHTYLKSRYKKILYHQILSPKLLKQEDTKVKTEFIRILKANRHKFYRYYYRWSFILGAYFFRRFIMQKKEWSV